MDLAKILITDDSKAIRTFIKRVISRRHVAVGEAANGADAVKKYEQLNPDIVLMDIGMPGMDGIQATKDIVTKHTNAKILMCSSFEYPNIIKEALNAGAVGYIVKPFHPEELLREIDNLLTT